MLQECAPKRRIRLLIARPGFCSHCGRMPIRAKMTKYARKYAGTRDSSLIRGWIESTAVPSRPVLTYFDLVGTVGLERDCSHSSFPFQPVCVRCELVNSVKPILADKGSTGFSGETVQLDSGAGVSSRGQRLLLTRNSLTRKYLARQASQKTVLAILATPSGQI